MKSLLNKNLVESLNDSNNEEYLNQVNEFVYNLVESAINDISSPFVNIDKCIMIPANEICTNSIAQLSQFDYFLGIDNVQIELNSPSHKYFWKYAWREFRASFRLGKKKYKKSKKKAKEIELPSLQQIEKYKLSDFRHDLFQKIVNYLSSSTIIYENSRGITFEGKEDLGTGVRVNIYVAVFDPQTQTFKMYNEIKNKFSLVNFGKRFDYIDLKTTQCGDMYKKMIRIFNSLYSKAYNRIPNQILLESILFSCPNLLYDKKDLYKTFINIVNYICCCNPRDFVSICDVSKNIFEEPLILKSNSQADFTRIIRLLENFKY